MKKSLHPSSARRRKGRHILAARLKLTMLLSVIIVFPLTAGNAAAQKNVSLSLKDVTLEQFFDQIRRQTGDIIMFSDDEVDIRRTVSVEARNEEVARVLDRVLRGMNLGHRVVDDYILIYRTGSQAQTPPERLTVTGRVTDRSGAPLIGANVWIDGTTIGVATDAEGRYSLSVPTGDRVLKVSYIGYKPHEERVAGRAVVDIALDADQRAIDDVIVTGYFTRSTDSFTGSVNTIKQDQLLQANPTNLLSALSIIEPSFKMVENITDGSNPNVIPEFQIRGSSSLPAMTENYQGSPNMPTFIMDGFEVSAEKVFDLDPMRVESITILKDAAATSFYGSRAANGVVVITTKVPPSGKLDITYNVDMGLTYPDLTDYDLLNAREKVDLEVAGEVFMELPGNPYWNELVRQNYSKKMELLARGNNTYWLNKPLRNAFTHKHSLTVEGGEGALRFAVDVGFEKAPGIMKGSDRTRKNMAVTLQYSLGEKLVFRNQTTYGDVTAKNSPYGNFSQYALLNPYYAIDDDNGNPLFWLEHDTRNVLNPLFNIGLNTIDKTRYNEWLNNFSVNWWITPGLSLKGTFSLSHRDDEGTVFKPGNHTDFANIARNQLYRAGSYSATDGRAFSYDASLVLSYSKTWGRHFLNANAVVQAQESSADGYTMFLEGFPDDNLDYLAFAKQYNEDNLLSATDEKSRMIGLVASANYAYDNRFLADVSLRADASSRFGADSRWAPFWSVGLGWNIHNEKFLEPVRWIDRLRLRATFGYTGSQNFNPYQAMTMYSYNLDRRYIMGVGATMMGMGNDDLRWQQNAKTNVGIDLDILNDKVGLRFEWYNEKSTNLLTDISIAPSQGFGSYRDNLGDIQNRGWEASVRVTVFRNKDGYVNISAAAIRNRNKLLKLSESLSAWNAEGDAAEDGSGRSNKTRVRYVEGQSLNTIWGLRSLGINPTTGEELYLTREGKITNKWESKNQVPIGIDEPDFEGNVGINAGYKGFQLNAYFNYRVGGQTYNQTLVERVENADVRLNADRRVATDRWQKAGDVAYFKKLTSKETTQATSRFVNDYSFLRFSSLSLSYDFAKQTISALRMKGLRLTFSMNDIFRVSTVKEERGIAYPFSRSARVSLRVTF